MSDIHSQKQLDELRKRLYARDGKVERIDPATLTATLSPVVEVRRAWDEPVVVSPQVTDLRAAMPAAAEGSAAADVSTPAAVVTAAPRRRYRLVIVLASLILFVAMAGTASLYLYFGANEISANNVSVTLTAPGLIGGGEVLPLQAVVSNQNAVAIESVTLIMQYPPGTQSADEEPRSLVEERIPIDTLAAGESRNIPIRAVFFGTENEERTINGTLEYRIANSNGTFVRDAEPLSFRLTSSPLVLTTSAPVNVSAGQEVTIDVILRSNAVNDLQNVLVTANYPVGFIPTKSDPAPASGDAVWRIDTVPAQESVTIRVSGFVEGLTNESMRVAFSAGLATSPEATVSEATLATAAQDFLIENPFIRVVSDIEGRGASAVLPPNEQAQVKIEITNTLSEPVFDMVVEVIPRGNVIGRDSVLSGGGFYDSNTNTIRWSVRDNPRFERVNAGDSRELSFNITPLKTVLATAGFAYDVNVFARRVIDNQSIEQLIGTASGEAKYHSTLSAGRQVAHNTIFTGRGPIPPRVGETTTYTITLVAEAGANNLENARASTRLTGVTNWEGQVDGDGELVYNEVTNELEWAIGSIQASQRAEVSFQVSVTPSRSQIGQTIVLLEDMNVRANDQFTGTQLLARTGRLTNILSTEAGFSEGNGVVRE